MVQFLNFKKIKKMIIEDVSNGDLDFNTPNYKELEMGFVVFPESIEEVKIVEKLKQEIMLEFKKSEDEKNKSYE